MERPTCKLHSKSVTDPKFIIGGLVEVLLKHDNKKRGKRSLLQNTKK